MVDTEEFADLRMNAGLTSTNRFDLGLGATHVVHVGRWAPDVADDPFEVFVLGHGSNFVEHRFFRTRLNNATLVGRNGTERASTETTSHDRDRILDHVEGWDGLRVAWMCSTGVRQTVDAIHGFLADGQLRHVANNRLCPVPLHDATCVEWVCFVVNDASRFGESNLVRNHFLVGWQFQCVGRKRFRSTKRVGNAAHVA